MGRQRAEGVDVTVARLAAEYWSQFLDDEPLVATDIGLRGHDHVLPDLSPEAIERRKTRYDEALRLLATIDSAELVDRDSRRIAGVIGFHASTRRAWLEREGHVRQLVSHLDGPAQLLAQLAVIQRVGDHASFAQYRDRLHAFPSYLDAAIDQLRTARLVRAIPRVVVDRSIGQLERLLDSSSASWPMPRPVTSTTPWGNAIERFVDRDLRPAFGRFLDALREARPSAAEQHGVGDDEYRVLVRYFTGSAMTPLDLHDLGLAEVDRIGRARSDLLREAGETTADALVRTYADRHQDRLTRDGLLRWIELLVDRGRDGTASAFGSKPIARCEVRLVEPWREQDVAAAFYESSSADGSRPGVYFVNAPRFGRAALHRAPTNAFHEGNPGHHFQLSLERESGRTVDLLRHASYLSGDAFLEGWGLYAETLADELGLFAEPAERLGYLDNEMLRACRLVVDTGVHALAWDREQAIEYLVSHGEPTDWAAMEVDRYAAIPGQALAYKLGQLAILHWRRVARRAGASLLEFHDPLLATGSLPLEVIERELPWSAVE